MAETYSAGVVTAYGAAVRGGYTGTYAQFCAQQASYAENARQVAEDRAAVEQMAETFEDQTVPAAVGQVNQAGAAQVQAVQAAGADEESDISAAGATQVQAVQTAGSAQVTAVQAAGAAQVTAVQSAGTTQVAAVNTAGSTQVQAVNAAGATQVDAVEDKGTEVIASIPQDYSALSGEVDDLKSATNNVLYLNNPTFEQYKSLAVVGGMSQGNVNPSQTWRVSINSLLSFPFDTRVFITSGYQIAFHFFENGVFVSDSGWQEMAYAIPANTTFKCTMNKKNSYSDADIATFLSQVSIDYPLFRKNVPSVIPYNEVLRDYALETQIQDAIIADGILYQFTGADTEVSGYAGHIIRINLSTFELFDNVYHRLGHVSCLGYCNQNDTLFSGRVIDSVPKIQIYKGFVSAAIEGAELSPENANCITINLSPSLLGSNTSFDVALGEHKNILYGYCTKLSETNNIVLLYKILIGTGSIDLSAETDGYGSLISAVDGEYNGTCKIIGTWYLPSVNRQPQLIRWHKGNLYMMTSNHDTIVHKYKFVDNEFLTDELIFINDIDASGNVIRMEAESLTFVESGAYMTLWDKSTPTKMRLLRVSV